MDKIYDFIILGAGPAGCFCASELVKKGYTVCILEKNKKNTRKVCGDGINSICTEVLGIMDFPIEKLMEAGGFPIKKYYIYRDNSHECINLLKKQKFVLGLPRNQTDLVFQEYVKDNYNIPIFYNTYACNIESFDGFYSVCGYKTKKIVIAAGSNASIQLDRNPFISVNKDRPLGVSMIVNSKEAEEPYFLFDYDSEYHGTYAWIFCIGKGKYNIGMWLKEEKTKIREKMDLFMKSRVTEWLGNDYEVEIPLKGSLMGIGKPIVSNTDDIIIIGDAANSSNELDGEGISKAIISAKEAILKIKDNI